MARRALDKYRTPPWMTGRGMSQGLFLERCFEIASKAVIAAMAQQKEPTR